jgi:hypothetical protein
LSLYQWIKDRYDLYLQDPKKHDLLMFVLSDEQAKELKMAGLESKQIIMRSEVPAVLKALEDTAAVEQISLF